MYSFLRSLVLLLAITASSYCYGQDRRFHLVGGSALSFVSKVGIEAECTPMLLPHAALSYSAPISRAVSVKSGVGYQQKGFKSQTDRRSYDPNLFSGERRYHFIQVPLELSVKVLDAKGHQLFLSGGMSYAFLAKVRTKIEEDDSRFSRMTKQLAYDGDDQIGLFPPSSPVRTDGVQFNLFNPMVIGELSYVLRNRWVARLFYEYALYDIPAQDYPGSMHLQSAGVSLGVAL